eukprot:3234851-Rhodomonas_salina.1
MVGLPADAVRSPPPELKFISGVFFTNINRLKYCTTCGTCAAYAFTREADTSGRTRLCVRPGRVLGHDPGLAK